jgi:membrane protein implicated in regulation of membrane protease activity
MAEKWHSGITMHKLSVGPGIMGLVFGVGCALIFVIGLPALWSFVAFSAALGLAVALLLRTIYRRREDRMKPLSILQVSQKPESPAIRKGSSDSSRTQKLSPQPAH